MATLPFFLLAACGFGLEPVAALADADDDDDGGGTSDFNLCGNPEGRRGSGTWSRPIRPETFPFVDDATTSVGKSSAETYDCNETLARPGPEVVYSVDVPEGATLRATLLADAGQALNLNVLFESARDGSEVTGCTRASRTTAAEAEAAEGEWLVVVDTLDEGGGTVEGGGYRLSLELNDPASEWEESQPASGITWRRRTATIEGSTQSWNVLAVDPTLRTLRPRALSCTDIPQALDETEAFAAISGGFYDTGCASLSLLRAAGTTLNTNRVGDRSRALVWNDGGAPTWTWVEPDADYTTHENAIGGWPSLVKAGAVELDPPTGPAAWDERRARTAVGIDAEGRVMLVTVDGGTARGDGLTMTGLAEAMVELGAVGAVALQGDEGTTAWVRDCSTNGIVNWPIGGDGTARGGAAAIPDALVVF